MKDTDFPYNFTPESAREFVKRIGTGALWERSCGATGPHQLECELLKGHEGNHEVHHNGEEYEWADD